MSINKKLFYGESSKATSKFVCVWDDTDSDQDSDDMDFLDSEDEFLPPDAEVSTDGEEEAAPPPKKKKLNKRKKRITMEEYPDEEVLQDDLASQVDTKWKNE
nr:uncharacterized protein LOC128696004 [Cherax quadricarinatus]